MPKKASQLRRSIAFAILLPLTGWFAGSGWIDPGRAMAIEGTELTGGVGVWAPLLPSIEGAGGSQNGDSIGTIINLRGHHRFDGYLTSIEGGVSYGVTNSTEMLAFDALLRDTWSFGIGDLSAGTGYSQMNWKQEGAGHQLDSDYRGAKVVAGWEAAFGRKPVWVDLTLGLYDFNGFYRGQGAITSAEIGTFTTTWGVDVKTEHQLLGIPVRSVFGLTYLDDITTWQNGQIGTDNAVVLTAGLEFFLF